MKTLILLIFMVFTARAVETEDLNLIIYYLDLPLTKENVRQAIKDFELQKPDKVLQHAIIESGNFKSKLTTRGNNLFGMRKNRRGWCENKELYGYATYKCWIYSIMDYKEWQGGKTIKGNYNKYLVRRRYF